MIRAPQAMSGKHHRHAKNCQQSGSDLPTMTIKEENSGTAIVTPDKHSAYMRPMFPKKIHTPEAMAKPIRGAFSCRTKQLSSVQNSSGFFRIARALLCGNQRTQRCSTHVGSCLYEVFKVGLKLLTCASRSCCMNCSFGCGLPAIASTQKAPQSCNLWGHTDLASSGRLLPSGTATKDVMLLRSIPECPNCPSVLHIKQSCHTLLGHKHGVYSSSCLLTGRKPTTPRRSQC